MKKVASTAGC